MKDSSGPVEAHTWPSQLTARAVSTEGEPRLLGYDVERDLARHYAFSEVLLLSLTGELPSDPAARAFEIALVFATPISVAEAPAHAAMLARLCGVRPGGVLSVAAMGLGEQVNADVDAILAALEAGPLPDGLRAKGEADRASARRLAELVTPHLRVPALEEDPSRAAAVIAVLRACGLTNTLSVISAIVIARMTSVLAEAIATKPGDFKSYPMDTPHFEYVP